MVAYEFYLHDKGKGDKLVGILPEKRNRPERINKVSIMRWGRKLLGDTSGVKNNIYFTRIEV